MSQGENVSVVLEAGRNRVNQLEQVLTISRLETFQNYSCDILEQVLWYWYLS